MSQKAPTLAQSTLNRMARAFLYLFGKKRTVVFILSSQRAGSTLLKALLAEGRAVSHIPEFRFEKYDEQPLELLYQACALSPERILVLKQPALFENEASYPRIHPFWKTRAKYIVLFREPKAVLESIENAAADLNTGYRNYSPERRIAHWLQTYQGLVKKFGGADRPQNVAWVSYEDLTRDPKAVTRRLFHFIGAENLEGTDTYRKANGVDWNWGKDDGGELIRSLRVIAPEEKPKVEAVLPPASLTEAQHLYEKMTGFKYDTFPTKPRRLVDTAFFARLKMQRTPAPAGKPARLLGLFPYIGLDAQKGGNQQASRAFLAALQDHYGADIEFCTDVPLTFLFKVLWAYDRARYLLTGNPQPFEERKWNHYGRAINRHLKTHHYEAVFHFAPFSWAHYLETKSPFIAMWDAFQQQIFDLYQPVKIFTTDQDALLAADKNVATKCTAIVLPCEFSVQGFKNYISPDTSKVRKIPYGANLPGIFQPPEKAVIDARTKERLELIFVNSMWERKGGPVAIQVLNELRSRGVPARLTIVGYGVPSASWKNEPDIEFDGELLKTSAKDLDKYKDLMSRSHVLLLPSRAEVIPGLIREANLMGVPCMASPTGALPEMIEDGVTGWLIPRNAVAYANKLEALWKNKEKLFTAAHHAYNYGQQFTWENTAQQLAQLIEATVTGRMNPADLKQRKQL